MDINKNRPTREVRKGMLLPDMEPNWKEIWWGMPEFEMKDATPKYQITINFMTKEDVEYFSKKIDIPLSHKSDSIFYPPQKRLKNSEYEYVGNPTDSRYPICLPSKGRAETQTTGLLLDKLGVSYKFFVEETEARVYKRALGRDKVVVMPFHDLGQGSIPARNFIWEWAKENGHKRHWVVDDNINMFTRCNLNRRLQVRGGGFFQAMEDFVDRYKNIALAGPHDQGFVADRQGGIAPYHLNSRVYSCTLIDTSLPHRWRGRYNEDTDLSLRLLKDGYCTILFRAFLMNKMATHTGAGQSSAMKGGNTDNVYNTNDYRLSFAESLKEQHPDCVEITWKFGRYHHQVDYSKFKRNKLQLCDGITPIKTNNEYGMTLVRSK